MLGADGDGGRESSWREEEERAVDAEQELIAPSKFSSRRRPSRRSARNCTAARGRRNGT